MHKTPLSAELSNRQYNRVGQDTAMIAKNNIPVQCDASPNASVSLVQGYI